MNSPRLHHFFLLHQGNHSVGKSKDLKVLKFQLRCFWSHIGICHCDLTVSEAYFLFFFPNIFLFWNEPSLFLRAGPPSFFNPSLGEGTIAVPVATNVAGRMRFLIPWRSMWRPAMAGCHGVGWKELWTKTTWVSNGFETTLVLWFVLFFFIKICHDLRSKLVFPLETLLDTYDTRDELAMLVFTRRIHPRKWRMVWVFQPTNPKRSHVFGEKKGLFSLESSN